MRNLDNGSNLNPESVLPITKEVIDRIRSISDATIACGGPAFSVLPEVCFDLVGPDVGITGSGGDSFADLADRHERGESYRDLPGAGDIDATRRNQPDPNPGKKRGQCAEEKIAKGNCRHNFNIGKGCEGGRIGIGKGIYQQNLIRCARKDQDPDVGPGGIRNGLPATGQERR